MSSSAELVRAVDLTVGYGRHAPLLRDFHLSVSANTILALTGASGVGKSTLLYALAGMIPPREGSVDLLGARITAFSERARSRHRARHIGFVFQDSMLDPARRTLDLVTETAIYAGVDRRSLLPRAHELLEELGVGELAHRTPGQISGGQAQRIALARALATAPRIVFADEPTANLDPASATIVMSHLEAHVRAVKGVLIIATHNPAIVQQSDRSVHLS